MEVNILGHYLLDSVTAFKGVVSFMERNTLFSKFKAKYILNEMVGVEISASQRIFLGETVRNGLPTQMIRTDPIMNLYCINVCMHS